MKMAKTCNDKSIYIYGHEDENYDKELKASCPECGCVIPFIVSTRGVEFCPYCGCEFDRDMERLYVSPGNDIFMKEYSMQVENGRLTVNAILEIPDFWEAEYGDSLECESNDIVLCIDHNTGTTHSWEGASRLDYSDGLMLSKYDGLRCMLNVDEFNEDFKRFALEVIDKDKDFFDGVSKCEVFDFAFLANRYPFFTKEQLAKIIHSDNASSVYGIIRKIAYNDNEATIIQKLQKECGVKFSKNVVKKFVENPAAVYDIMVFGEYFSNIDLLDRFIDNELAPILNHCSQYFIKRIIDVKGEVGAINFFIKGMTDPKMIEDASSFYSDLNTKHGHLITDDVMKGNAREVHDKLSAIRSNINYPNHPIHYTKEERSKYCRIIDGIKFYLPENTHMLIHVGQVLHNCVANYREKAESKACTIIIMSQGSAIVGCIEVDATGSYVEQVRGACNEFLYGPYLEAFNKYKKITGLSTAGCNNLTPAEMAGVDEDEAYDLDFHDVEFDDNGNIVEL